jgi:hypothetical protein
MDPEKLEKSTRGQADNYEWHKARIGRITGSTCGQLLWNMEPYFKEDVLLSGRNALRAAFVEEDEKKLSQDMGLDPPAKKRKYISPAMMYGTKEEKNARQSYLDMLGEDWTCKELGLCVAKEYGVLAISPDGVLVNQKTGEQRLLEIKCPYTYRNCDLRPIANKNPDFYLCNVYTSDGEQLALKTNERGFRYFAQIQLALYILDLERCDFVVYTKSHTHVMTIARHTSWSDKCVPMLLAYWWCYCRPVLGDDRCNELQTREQARNTYNCLKNFLDENKKFVKMCSLINERACDDRIALGIAHDEQ